MAIGEIAGAVGGLFSAKKAKKAAKKQKRIAQQIQKEAVISSEAASQQFGFEQEIQRVAQARANIQARRDQIEMTREARVRRAAIVASAAASGVGLGTTGIESGAGSVVSQFGANVGLFNIAKQAAGETSRLNELSAEQQRIQLESQGRVNVLQGQSQVIGAKLEKSQAGIKAITGAIGAAGSIFETIGGGFFPKPYKGA